MEIVLSLDGGGVRGIIQASILDHIETKIQEIQGDSRIRIGNLMDLVAGTSTGSIVGSLMLIPQENTPWARYSMKEITQFYVDFADEVFKNNPKQNWKTVWGLLGPKYPSSNIDAPLLKLLDHYKMSDLINPCLFTGYDIGNRKNRIYTNKDVNHSYANYWVKDIVRGSTAIPSYFIPAYFRDGIDINTIIDGGVFANNPALVAYLESSKTLFHNRKNAEKKDPNNLIVLSIGSGLSSKKEYEYNETKKWGKVKWLAPILEILMSASSETTNYEMEKLYQSYDRLENYIRINVPLKYGSSSPTDASKQNMLNLLKDSQIFIQENQTLLNTIAREICDIHYLIRVED